MRTLYHKTLVILPLLWLGGCDLFTEPSMPCTDPAPLLGSHNPAAPGYIVVYHEGIPVEVTTEQLAEKHGFTARHIYTLVLNGFAAELSAPALMALRCEPVVHHIGHDGVVSAAL